jgi:hypothetical protein
MKPQFVVITSLFIELNKMSGRDKKLIRRLLKAGKGKPNCGKHLVR